MVIFVNITLCRNQLNSELNSLNCSVNSAQFGSMFIPGRNKIYTTWCSYFSKITVALLQIELFHHCAELNTYILAGIRITLHCDKSTLSGEPLDFYTISC